MATPVQTRPLEAALAGIPLPATLRSAVPFTDDELLLFSSRNTLYRVERNARGELEIMTPVGGEGSRWEAYVVRALDLWTEQHGGVCFSSNGGFSLPDGAMLSPDTAWVSQQCWDALSDAERSTFPPLCPEFVIEVLSASDSRPVLRTKMLAWLANGAQLAWLIDPRAGEVSIYRAGREPEILPQPESVCAEEPIAGFCLDCSRFWK